MDSNFDSKPPKGKGKGREVKFEVKAKARRRVPKIEVKSEVVEEEEEDNKAIVQAKEMQRRLDENKARMKVEKRASYVAFGSGARSTSLKSYAFHKSESTISGGENSAFDGAKVKEYKEPWDLYSDYPLVLPLRKPYSGNPEYLNEEEFGEAAESRTYDESTANSAMELGLLEENPEATAFFMKLPPIIPMLKKVEDVKDNVKRPGGPRGAAKLGRFNELPAGLIGKMVVYKSGKVKLKLGDTLYDVSSGMNCTFSQELVAMNTAEKHCCTIGEISKLATVTPDIDAALDCLSDLDL